jgi:hypothetical protein
MPDRTGHVELSSYRGKSCVENGENAMNAYRNLLLKALRVLVPGILVLLGSPGALRAQFLQVDCSGTNPYAYSHINDALQSAGPGAFILVAGTCNENVFLWGQKGLNLGAYSGQTANVNGALSVGDSESIYVYGLNVTNASGDGITVRDSRSVVLDTCASNGNAGVGLLVGGMSDVSVSNSGTFDYNAKGGMNIGGNSIVGVGAWAGLVDISNNGGPGVYASQCEFSTLGSTTIANNLFGAGSASGFGIDLRGGARVQFGALLGPNHVSGNQSGGAWLQETAEISFWSIGYPNLIQGNGPVGVSVGLGSQATFADITGPLGTQITGHSSAGIDVYANSQIFFLGTNVVQGNGSSADARSAGIRVDGNSEAFLRGGQVSGNTGPGILALVNSSADFSGVSFGGNSGVITCDSSSTMVSDLAGPNSTPAGVSCRTPHGLGGRQITKTQPTVPDWSARKAQHDKYIKLAVKH